MALREWCGSYMLSLLLTWTKIRVAYGEVLVSRSRYSMKVSSNGNIFWVTGSLWGESTSHRWIPLTKASDAEFWCFLWCTTEEIIEQNDWDTSDLRRLGVHCDVTVMQSCTLGLFQCHHFALPIYEIPLWIWYGHKDPYYPISYHWSAMEPW